MKIKPNFVLEDNFDPQHQKTVISKIREVVRLGERAKQALLEIERQGYCATPVPFASGSDYCGWKIEVQKLPRREEVSRDSLPKNYQNLSISFGDIHDEYYAGKKYQQVPVILASGYLLEQKNGKYTPKKKKVTLGEFRILKTGISWCNTETGGYAQNVNQANSRNNSAWSLANILIDSLVVGKNLRTRQIQYAGRNWLLEDGVVSRLFREMLDYADVHRIMAA